MAYPRQPPYQTTVNNPVVVQPVQPVVVPVVTVLRVPIYRSNGAKLCGHFLSMGCICFICVFGCLLILMSLIMVITAYIDYDRWKKIHGPPPPQGLPGLILGLIGVPIVIMSCYLCIIAKKNKDEQQRHENTSPQSEPFTDAENSPGYVYSGQGQPAVGQPVVGTAYPVYVPVQPAVLPPTSYPHQSTGEVAYSAPPSYSVPDKGLAPEYDQQPAYAPPTYSP